MVIIQKYLAEYLYLIWNKDDKIESYLLQKG